MGTTQQLLDYAAEVWTAYNEHPFVLGIQNGTLEKEKFRFYMIQDYLYLGDYAKIFALGVAKATSLSNAMLFSKYISVMNGELNVHSNYMARLGITQEDIDSAKRSLDSLSYTSYMLRVAYEETEVEIVAAILACAYSYEVIAKKIVENNPAAVDDEFYGSWISGYVSEEYSEENRVLIELLDDMTKSYTPAQTEHLKDVFLACSRYEMAFWDLSWNMSF